MAIQFNCVSCQKAIEVADEWSCRLVECPYCGDTITAPGITQPPPKAAVPTARPIAGIEGSIPQPTYRPPSEAYESSDFELAQPRKRFDGLALTGLLFCLASMAFFVWCIAVMLGEVIERVGLDAPPEKIQAFIEEAAENQSAWLLKLSGLAFLAFGVWLVGAIISCTAFIRNRKYPRGKLAFWALLLCAYLPLLMLLGVVVQ